MNTTPAADRRAALRSALLEHHATLYRRAKARRRAAIGAAAATAAVTVALTAGFLAPAPGAAPLPDYSALASGGSADITVVDSPAELLPGASLVVTGRVAGIASIDIAGRLGARQEPTLLIEDVTIVHGQRDSLDTDSGTLSIVLATIDTHLRSDLGSASLETYFPVGTRIVAYLSPGYDYEGIGIVEPWWRVAEPAPEAGFAAYWLGHPQGLAIQLPGSEVVIWPLFNGRVVNDYELPGS